MPNTHSRDIRHRWEPIATWRMLRERALTSPPSFLQERGQTCSRQPAHRVPNFKRREENCREDPRRMGTASPWHNTPSSGWVGTEGIPCSLLGPRPLKRHLRPRLRNSKKPAPPLFTSASGFWKLPLKTTPL